MGDLMGQPAMRPVGHTSRCRNSSVVHRYAVRYLLGLHHLLLLAGVQGAVMDREDPLARGGAAAR